MLKALSFFPAFGSPHIKTFHTTKSASQITGAKILAGCLIALNLGLLLSYIFGVNFQASAGYEIKALQNQINSLSQDNKKMNLSIAEKTSITNMESELVKQGFLPVKSAIYLEEQTGLTMR